MCANYLAELSPIYPDLLLFNKENNLKIQKKGEIIERLDYMKRIFKKDINNNDVVMIKGSNATGLFKISQNLKKGRINAI